MGYFTSLKFLSFSTLFSLFAVSGLAQQSHPVSVKFNLGTSFSKPTGELGQVATKGKAMQLATSLEVGYHFNYTKNSKFGIRVAGVAGQDWANFLSNDRLTELKVSVPSVKGRIYPFSYDGPALEAFEKVAPGNLPFLIEMPVLIGIYTAINSLHFDYGVGSGKILETAYVDEVTFQDQTVKRTMKYFGWGFQPVIYQSDSEKWSCNAQFDFGKYSWKNANGGTSSFKSNQVGFGVQYNF